MLKEKLEILLDRIGERDIAQRDFALGEIVKEIQGATSSMTSVPKPLKFLSNHYKRLREMFEAQTDQAFKVNLNTNDLS